MTYVLFFKVDTQEEAIRTLTSAKERIEKEKYKLGKAVNKMRLPLVDNL